MSPSCRSSAQFRIRWSSRRSPGRCSERRCSGGAGIKLPGLEFKNQRVEAAYRKELVYGEDDADARAAADGRRALRNVRRNYFRLYFHYVYFNVVRSGYLQADAIFSSLILIPTIAAGKITLGILAADCDRLRPGQLVVPVSGQFLADDRRADFDPQAPARLRGDAGGRAAARDRPALSGTEGQLRLRSSWRNAAPCANSAAAAQPPTRLACAALRRPRPRQIVAVAGAHDVGLDADLFGEALERAPVGAVVHQREMEAELQRNALAREYCASKAA